MKKILLIPTVLAIASAPIISLVGCNHNPEYDPYVTDEEMDEAVSLSREKYAQFHYHVEFIDNITLDTYFECSPLIFHLNGVAITSHIKDGETFCIKNGDHYMSIYREPDASDWVINTYADDRCFLKPSDAANATFYKYYKTLKEIGLTPQYDSNEKCYKVSFIDPEGGRTGVFSLHFRNKKLTRFWVFMEGKGIEEYNLTYDNVTPQLPHNPKLDDGSIEVQMIEAISLANFGFIQIHVESQSNNSLTVTDYQLSPYISHIKETNDGKTTDEYVVHDERGGVFTKIYQTSDEPGVWKEEEVEQESLILPSEIGEELLKDFNKPIQDSKSYEFNEQEECYSAYSPTYDGTYSYYFNNKRLNKAHIQQNAPESTDLKITFQYEMITPELPVPQVVDEIKIYDQTLLFISDPHTFFEGSYYKIYTNSFVSNGKTILCRGMQGTEVLDNIRAWIREIKVNGKHAEWNFNGNTISFADHTPGICRIEIYLKFYEDYEDLAFFLAN